MSKEYAAGPISARAGVAASPHAATAASATSVRCATLNASLVGAPPLIALLEFLHIVFASRIDWHAGNQRMDCRLLTLRQYGTLANWVARPPTFSLKGPPGTSGDGRRDGRPRVETLRFKLRNGLSFGARFPHPGTRRGTQVRSGRNPPPLTYFGASGVIKGAPSLPGVLTPAALLWLEILLLFAACSRSAMACFTKARTAAMDFVGCAPLSRACASRPQDTRWGLTG